MLQNIYSADGELIETIEIELEQLPMQQTMSTEEAALDMMADIEYRLGLLELGVQTKEVTL